MFESQGKNYEIDSMIALLQNFMQQERPDLYDIFQRVIHTSEDHAGYPYTLPHTATDKVRALCMAPFMLCSVNNLGETFKPSCYLANFAKEE